jgi:hypothetical protein
MIRRHLWILLMLPVALWSIAAASRTYAPQALEMRPTVYDDGKSCPNNCDAHVVFADSHNGTRNAYDPASSRNAPRKCTVGQKCMICFSEQASSCLAVTYRGSGPPKNRFDFTPAFFEENCEHAGLPVPLARMCSEAKPEVERLRTRVNCFQTPEHPQCKALMKKVMERKAADEVLYAECKSLGQAAFNTKYKNQPAKQRINDCQYEKLKRGGLPQNRWHLLLDGACRAGTYVGRDGLDCCSGNLYQAALLGRECRLFFPAQQ